MTDTLSDAAPAETAIPAPAKDEGGWLAELRNLAILLLIVLGIHSFVAKPFYIPSASMMPVLLKGDRLVVSKYPYGWSYASVSFHLLPPFAGRMFASMPARGDIVIVEPNGVRTDYTKRVIGLPGDLIEVRSGRLFLNGVAVPAEVRPVLTVPIDLNIDDPADMQDGCTGREVRGRNGEALCELQIVRETLPNGVTYDTVENGFNPATEQYGPYRVPAGHVFLMGDNRDHSADSRFESAAQDPNAVGLGGSVPFEQIGGRAEFITFSLDGSSQWYNPLSWFTAMRSGRAGDSLRPVRGTPPRRAAASPRAPTPAN